MWKVLHFLLLFYLTALVWGGLKFRLGRSQGGNLGAPGDYKGEPLPKPRWFKQRLDHSSATNLQTFKQRYFINDSFFNYKDPGPIFLMIGGEGPADPKWMVKGAWIEFAERFNAMCILLEHRYYGQTHPTEDTSTKNLQYLSSYQALADLANFISQINNKFNFQIEVRWVVFGGSYPGSLAAWLRVKYPHLVYGAISSSGPLYAKVNFLEYFEVVVQALHEKTGGNACVGTLKLAHKQISKLLTSNPTLVEKSFKVCKPFTNATKLDIRNFFNSIADDFADLVQYNEDNRIGADKRYKKLTINTVCDMLTTKGIAPAYKKVAAFNAVILEKSKQTCLDYSYDNMINELRNVTWRTDGARQWMYQTCTEFGFYQTSTATADVFGNVFNLDFFIKQCQDIFGLKFNEDFINAAAAWTNANYGALNISVGRVVFVHGSVDPWHVLGITKTLDNNAPAIFIPGTAHCADMYPSNANDSGLLVAARLEIEQHLNDWVGLP